MITVELTSKGQYMVKMDVPELHVIRKIAVAYSMREKTALVAVINRGMDSISKQLQAIADKKNEKPTSDVSDHITYNKGSCQG